MKLRKFNENNSSNWDQRIRTNVDDRKSINRLLDTYLYWKLDNLVELNEDTHYYYIFDFYFYENGTFLIKYEECGEEDEILELSVKEYDELVEFINNPEFFIEQEKYNL